jgi:dihydrofolate synthase/folylpolyglutamate synthase
MTYPDTLEYLFKLDSAKIHLGLCSVRKLLDRLDNPQAKYKTILIGGTNGKGSVAAMLSRILEKKGLKVGLYTSPHLCDFRERIRINGRVISKRDLCMLTEKIKDRMEEDVTYFEFTTVLAFLYFCMEEVDIAVLEVGMGGRLDATNVVTPEVSVITNISLEHKKYLGNNLESIAVEKAGIIKEGGICVTAAKQKRVIGVFEEICTRRDARLCVMGKEIKIRASGDTGFSYYGIWKNYKNIRPSLIGKHQFENAAMAIAAVEILNSKGFDIDDDSVFYGISHTKWEGRLETICDDPKIIIDGAHNPAGVSALCKSIRSCFHYKKLILVLGILDDKDYKAMLKEIAPLSCMIILTKLTGERALDPKNMLSVATSFCSHVEVIESPDEAFSKAVFAAGEDDLVCIAGSLYLIGEAKRHFRSRVPRARRAGKTFS